MSVSVNNVSDPLKHLFSLDFSRTSPPLNQIDLNTKENEKTILSKQRKKVKFAEPFADTLETLHKPQENVLELKGILKKKLSLEEKEYSLANLNTEDDSYDDDDYTDFSSVEENSIDENFSDDENNVIHQTDNKISDIQVTEIDEKYEEVQTLSEENREMFDANVVNISTNSECIINENTSDDEVVNSDHFQQEYIINTKPIDKSYIPKTVSQKTNNHILHVLSKVKAETEKNNKLDCKAPLFNSSKITKHHFCISSSYEHKSKVSFMRHYKNNLSHARFNEIKKMLSNNLKNYSSDNKPLLDCDGRFLISQETLKLFSLLNENSKLENFSAKELRSIVYNAWYKVKKDKMLIDATNSKISEETKHDKQKIIKPVTITNGHLNWKRRKEYRIKTRKRNNMKSKQESKLSVEISEEEEKRKEEERKQVYNSWKKKKDEELKLKLQKGREIAQINKSNSLKNEEIKKKDAASAFYAWKTMKLNSLIKKQDEIKTTEIKNIKHSSDEKVERDKDAQAAYFEWLKKKEKMKPNQPLNNSDRPPWNPPG